ncbi:MAG: dienelactone hydrolase family protein [Bacteroides sp.]|nr:dienelactone hydrolase family protein [Bacteroides sp.]
MKSILFSFLLFFAFSNMNAQDFALQQLENSPRHQEWVEIQSGDRTLHAFVVYPEVSTYSLAVVVIHENAGLTNWVRSFSDQLAGKGFLVIAPDLLSSFDENHKKTSDFTTGDAARNAIYQLNPDQVTQDLEAALQYIAKDPSSNGKTAIMGFCWGGSETFRFATNNDEVLAGLVFYGSPPKNFVEIQKINAPVYGFYGGNDQRINATIPETEKWMKEAGKTFDYVIYPRAGHGYMRQGDSPAATPENLNAKNQSWQRIVEILERL